MNVAHRTKQAGFGRAAGWWTRLRRAQHGGISITAVLVAAVCISMAGFWTAYAENTRLQRTVESKLPGLVRPVLLNGFRLPLEEHVSLIEGPLARPLDDTALRLLIVSADTCFACVELMPQLKKLIDRLPSHAGDDVVVLSYVGRDLPSQLVAVAQRRQIPISIVRPIHRFDLFVHTGVTSTPTIVVLDSQSRVRFVSRTLDDLEIDWIANYFSRQGNVSFISRRRP